ERWSRESPWPSAAAPGAPRPRAWAWSRWPSGPGARIVAVGDASASAHNESGIDMDELERWLAHNRFLRGFPGAEALPERHSLLACPCEILIPAALEAQITEENAAEVKAEMIVE